MLHEWLGALAVTIARAPFSFHTFSLYVLNSGDFASYTIGVTQSTQRMWRDIALISFRSVATLSNAIIFVVLGLLFFYGEVQTALFLSVAVVAGVLIGVVNDVRARFALEKLQLLTASSYNRVTKSGISQRVYVEALQVNDRILLVLGDQVPCDSTLVEAHTLEISQALLTGESDSFAKKEGDTVLAGNIIVAGWCIARINTVYADSELSKMTSAIKRYSINVSPIQNSIQTVITYSGYGILALLAFVVARGQYLHESKVDIIQTAAALTSTLVPQGLIVAVTILFAYGAIRMYRDHVLMQDVNATEKLGHIKNLCIDKTGTLTENIPTVRSMHVFDGITRNEALALTATYIKGSGDSSHTVRVIAAYARASIASEVIRSLPFTSQRQFGAVTLQRDEKIFALIMGGPDTLLAHMEPGLGRDWLQNIASASEPGKRLVCLARAEVVVPPDVLRGVALTPIVVFELENALREGTRDTIDFFQKRGVRVRVISGDSPETVRAIAAQAGIHHSESSVVGSVIEQWSEKDFTEKLDYYTVFARVRPELKEKLIERFKKQGFTAMVGDGANDALAIKTADLGIAMFEGATATRQLASVVLMNNSFSSLPRGINLADTIIGNAAIISSLYFFEMGVGALLFVVATLLGYSYPLSPQNIILLNYCTVGLPGMVTFFWTMRGIGRVRVSSKSFLARVLPFALYSALAASVVVVGVFMYALMHHTQAHVHTLTLLSFILVSWVFFCAASFVYTQSNRRSQVELLLLFGAVELLIVYLFFHISFALSFFNITPVSLSDTALLSMSGILFAGLEYILIKMLYEKNI